MSSYSKDWLPHLKDSIPLSVQGLKVSSYAIALEGWRRGLTLKYYNIQRNPFKIRYSLSNGEEEIVFAGSRGSKVSDEAVKICIDKFLTKQYLIKANVPTPEGTQFDENHTNEEIISYAETLGYPLVVKPVDGSGGKGVIANIKSNGELIDALSIVREDMKFKKIIVEKYYEGVDYRVYVIGDKVVGAFDRIPANVVGDGINTIEKLLELKIEERQKNPALYNRPIIVDKEVHNLLRSKGYDMNTVPKKGERVFLKTKNNVSSGGDSRDVTDELTDEIKEIAVKATKAIPGLLQAGLDIIVNKETNTAVVLEINARPSIRNHLFPMIGKARDIPKEIIDFYFPETKNQVISPNGVLFYFDLKSINDIFRKGLAKEIVVPNMPKGDIEAKLFLISGLKEINSFKRSIQTHVRNQKLHGYMKQIENREDKFKIVLAGNKTNLDHVRSFIYNFANNINSDLSIKEETYNSPIQIGFEVILNMENSKNVTSGQSNQSITSNSQKNKRNNTNGVFRKIFKKLFT